MACGVGMHSNTETVIFNFAMAVSVAAHSQTESYTLESDAV